MESKNKIVVEITEYCTSKPNIKINGINFDEIENKKEFLIGFLTDLIEESNDDNLHNIISGVIYDHPRLDVNEIISDMHKCDQCEDFNVYEKFTINPKD